LVPKRLFKVLRGLGLKWNAYLINVEYKPPTPLRV
jgi:hypothetical protein